MEIADKEKKYIAGLAERVAAGEVLALARSISLVENDSPLAPMLLSALKARVGKAYRVGITGPPGAGKSTLTDRLALEARSAGYTVGILAVDPTSPFTGGALLGDRIRMNRCLADPGVYMRSMASRGSLGGLARTTREAADLLDASGKEYIFVETIGVGQVELDVAQAADTRVVVLVPESGGSIQAMKAGLMEIADILVVNKSDRAGADELEHELLQTVDLWPSHVRRAPILRTCAKDGRGVKDLFASIQEHREYLCSEGLFDCRRFEQGRAKIIELVKAKIESRFWQNEELKEFLDDLARAVCRGNLDAFSAAEEFARKAGLV